MGKFIERYPSLHQTYLIQFADGDWMSETLELEAQRIRSQAETLENNQSERDDFSFFQVDRCISFL